MRKGNCLECDECLPIGEGDHFCNEVMNLVLEDYQPTIHYGGCIKKRKLVRPKKVQVNKKHLKRHKFKKL